MDVVFDVDHDVFDVENNVFVVDDDVFVYVLIFNAKVPVRLWKHQKNQKRVSQMRDPVVTTNSV